MYNLSKLRVLSNDLYDRIWIWYQTFTAKKQRETQVLSQLQKSPLTHNQKKQIDSLYEECLGYKIPYDWHQYFAAHSGVFTHEYFPDFLLHGQFEHFMNQSAHYPFVFEDKNVLPYIAKAAGVLMPKTILSKTCGVLQNGDKVIVTVREALSILSESGKVFCKPSTGSCGGRGCFVCDFGSLSNEEEQEKTLNEMGEDFIVQECIQCHDSIKKIYPNAVNTFRIITYRWKDEFCHMPVFMRIGRGGSVVDNGASGGMFIGVRDDGVLTDYAVTHKETCIPLHPDTGVKFKGIKIPHFDQLLSSAIKMHTMIPQVGLVYWDFTLDADNNAVLIECNILNGTVYAIQMTHGVSPFGDKTREVLSWIKKMRDLPASQRHEFSYGRL